MLISLNWQILAAIELKYIPYGEARLKDDIEKLHWLEKLGPKTTIYLETDPHSGLYNKKEFQLSENLLSVYAAIAKGNHAWAVESREFWEKNKYELKYPKNLLHLVGRITKEKIEFCEAEKNVEHLTTLTARIKY